VRPHLEFSVTAWAPWLEGDKQILEKVQEKAINAISGLAAQTYAEKCKELGIETLAERRDIHDMLQVYKILNGTGNIDYTGLFTKINRETARTRLAAGHDNLVIKQARTDVRKHSFSVRVVQKWNGLPDAINQSRNADMFKNRLKEYKMGQVGGR
jgi:hypothetical protein